VSGLTGATPAGLSVVSIPAENESFRKAVLLSAHEELSYILDDQGLIKMKIIGVKVALNQATATLSFVYIR